MLRHRIIPIVLLDGYSVVKTIKFDVRRNLGNPITVARIYNSRNVDELILLDIDASKENRKIDLLTIEEISRECFMPLCVGGGLKTCDDIGQALLNGADKVAINTAALRNPEFIKEASSTFGMQCIVVSIDVKRLDRNKYRVYSHVGLETQHELFDWVKRMEALGAGELLINSVDLDGTMTGFDMDLISAVCDLVKIPVISAGGGSNPQDGVEAVNAGASAVAFSSIFHFTNFTPNDVKTTMHRAGIPVRLNSPS